MVAAAMVLEPLTLWVELLTIAVIEAPVFDRLFAGMVSANEEGTDIGPGLPLLNTHRVARVTVARWCDLRWPDSCGHSALRCSSPRGAVPGRRNRASQLLQRPLPRPPPPVPRADQVR